MADTNPFDIDGMKKLVDRALRRQTENEARSFRRGTATWKHKPTFHIVKSKDEIGYEVYTDSEIWKWVNFGTRRHDIFPVKAKALRFQTGYNPKTAVGQIGSVKGGKFGPEVTRASVDHPGIEPRRFDELVLDKAEERYERALLTEIDKMLAKFK